jgi:prepilin-type N-terminal cleavage/methylation domain-containing protein
MDRTILPYSKSLKDCARFLRRNATLAEVLLWKQLKQKRVGSSMSTPSRSGMTLLELLIAISLVAVAALVVAQAFAAGLKVWARASQLGGPYAESVMAMEGLQQDIRNTVPSRLATIRGGASWVEIPSLIIQTAEGGGRTEEPGLVRYEFDVTGKKLDRVTSAFEIVAPGTTRRETVAVGIVAVTLSYAEWNGMAGAAWVWGRTWEGRTNNPAAVKVVWSGQQGADAFEFERTILLPVR